MFRTIVLVTVVLMTAILTFGCTDTEKEQLKQDAANLRISISDRDQTILQMSTEALNKRDSLNSVQSAYAATIDSLSKSRQQNADRLAENRKLKAHIAELNADVERLQPFETAFAECVADRCRIGLALGEAQSTIDLRDERIAADSALLDSVKQCYDVQKHNASRSWWQHTWGSNKWNMPFAEPEFLVTPIVVTNPGRQSAR